MKSFWQHENGRVYAIRCDSFGNLTGAAGPLKLEDLKDLDDYKYGPGILDWVKDAMAQHKMHRIKAMPAK